MTCTRPHAKAKKSLDPWAPSTHDPSRTWNSCRRACPTLLGARDLQILESTGSVHTRGRMSHQHLRVLSIPVILLTLVCLGIFASPLLVYFYDPSHPDSAVFVGTAAVWLFAAAMVMALTLIVARFLKPTIAIMFAVVILATFPAALLLLYYRAQPALLASTGIQQSVALVGVSLLPPTILGWLIGHRLRLRRGRYAIWPRS